MTMFPMFSGRGQSRNRASSDYASALRVARGGTAQAADFEDEDGQDSQDALTPDVISQLLPILAGRGQASVQPPDRTPVPIQQQPPSPVANSTPPSQVTLEQVQAAQSQPQAPYATFDPSVLGNVPSQAPSQSQRKGDLVGSLLSALLGSALGGSPMGGFAAQRGFSQGEEQARQQSYQDAVNDYSQRAQAEQARVAGVNTAAQNANQTRESSIDNLRALYGLQAGSEDRQSATEERAQAAAAMQQWHEEELARQKAQDAAEQTRLQGAVAFALTKEAAAEKDREAQRGLTKRGQDISAANAAAARGLTTRGQDISKANAAAAHALGAGNLGVAKGRLTLEQQRAQQAASKPDMAQRRWIQGRVDAAQKEREAAKDLARGYDAAITTGVDRETKRPLTEEQKQAFSILVQRQLSKARAAQAQIDALKASMHPQAQQVAPGGTPTAPVTGFLKPPLPGGLSPEERAKLNPQPGAYRTGPYGEPARHPAGTPAGPESSGGHAYRAKSGRTYTIRVVK